jgi:hypothetical protein
MLIEIKAEPEFLRVSAQGTVSLTALKENVPAILAAISQHQVRKVLFDARGLIGHFTDMERFEYVSFLAEKALQSNHRSLALVTRYAYVLIPGAVSPQKFGETVAFNRGLSLRAFENLEEALGWLGVTADHSVMTQATILQGNPGQ